MKNSISFCIAFYNIGAWFIPLEDAFKGISIFLSTVYVAIKIYQEFFGINKEQKSRN